MSDLFDTPESEEENENFAELLEEYTKNIKDDISTGDRINGKIIAIGEKSVYVDTGSPRDGVVDKSELLDENGELTVVVDDPLDLYVVSITESELILSKALSGAVEDNSLRDACTTKTPVEGTVTEVIKGGFSVDLSGKRAFCPISQIDTRYVETPEEYLQKELTFLITRFEEKGRNIVVSRRDYLNIDIEEKRAAFFENTQIGDTVQGQITKLMPFGAFMELAPGVEGLIHVSELSWSRVQRPEEAVQKGDTVHAEILSIQKGNDAKSTRISLSIKKTLADPWELAKESLHAGDQITGTVTRLAPFGAFVEIAPGTEGLVHLSEMSYTKRILKADDAVSQGETVQVVIKKIELEKKRISLSIKDAHGDPWNGIAIKYPVGQRQTGTFQKKESFGYFITLEPGVTGLLPKNKIDSSTQAADLDRLKIGSPIEIRVSEIDEEKRRITFTPADTNDKNEWKTVKLNPSSSGMGSMGDLLKAAMEKKNK